METAEKKGCCKKETAPVVESLILELPQETRFELAKKYDEPGYIHNGHAWVKQGKKYGFIDKTGAEAIACKYDEAKDFSESLAAVKQGKKWGFVKHGRGIYCWEINYSLCK